MKTLSSLTLFLVFALFAWKKGPKPPVEPREELTGAFYGKYHSNLDSSDKNFVIILKPNGKMDVFDGDTLTGDKARGTFMIEGTVLYGNFQYIQDGPVTNIEARLNATLEIISGAWYCGNEGGSFMVDKPITHSVALQPGLPKQP